MFCIYAIINKINNKTYVGKTQNFQKRIKDHLKIANGGKETYPNSFSYVHAAINKYGKENFDFSILIDNIENESLAFELEKEKICELKTSGYLLYNLTEGGDGVVGHKFSKESKIKMSLAHIGKIPWNKGVPFTDEVKLKQSASAKLRFSKNPHPLRGKESHFKGKIRGKEFAEKISKTKSGKPHSTEHKLKLCKLTNDQIFEILNLISLGFSNKEISIKYGVHRDTISRIKNGKRCPI